MILNSKKDNIPLSYFQSQIKYIQSLYHFINQLPWIFPHAAEENMHIFSEWIANLLQQYQI